MRLRTKLFIIIPAVLLGLPLLGAIAYFSPWITNSVQILDLKNIKDCNSDEILRPIDCFYASALVCSPAKITKFGHWEEGGGINETAVIEGRDDLFGKCKVKINYENIDLHSNYEERYETTCYDVSLESASLRIANCEKGEGWCINNGKSGKCERNLHVSWFNN